MYLIKKIINTFFNGEVFDGEMLLTKKLDNRDPVDLWMDQQF